jgi:putative PEP-CTERM system histidine kinase
LKILLASYVLCSAVYLVLAALLAQHSARRAPAVVLVAACVATGGWALARTIEIGLAAQFGPLVGVLDAFRLMGWIAFLGVAYQAGLPSGSPQRLRWAAVTGLLLGLLVVGSEVAGDLRPEFFVAGLYGRLLLAIGGLIIAEALIRQARVEGLWRVRYLCLGVGGLLVYDIFVWSEGLLFARLEPMLDASRAAVSVVAAPLIAVAAARNPAWSTELNVARRAVFHSAIAMAVGIYLLMLAGAGALLRTSGGDWGRVLQAAFVFGGILLLVVIALSPSAQTTFKLRLGRYLFTHRHDYREQWQRFAEALAPGGGPPLAVRTLQALAGITGSARGGLWLREGDEFRRLAGLELPESSGSQGTRSQGSGNQTTGSQGPDARLAAALERGGDSVVELPEQPGDRPDWLPDWLRGWPEAWLVLPLVQHRWLVGFVVLSRPAGRSQLEREDEELLRTAALHAGSYLAAEQTARKLDDARRFEELSRGLAFMAHDLRNLANELTLTLANARKHIQNPEFQKDLLLSMEDSVAGMQRLLDKLSARQAVDPKPGATDFGQIVESSLARRAKSAATVRLEVEGERHLVACDSDQLISMSGHLVQNAIEAAGPAGRITVRLRREGDTSVLEVDDDGPGMTPEFVHEHLHHPFRSTKPGGFGLGLYECRELARKAGGDLAIDSAPGRGTTARLRLPIARPDAPDRIPSGLHGGR